MAAAKGSPIRFVAVGVVALLVGVVLGGLGPRAKLRALEGDGVAAEKCERSSVGRQLASAFRGRPWEARGDREPEARVEPEPAAEPTPEPDAPVEPFRLEIGDEAPAPEDVEEGMEMMRDAMRLRQSQARAALEEDFDPTDAQWDQIDATIDDMNANLQDLAGELVDTLGAGEEPTRREALLFAADTLDVMIEADDRLYETFTPEQRESMDEDAIDPFAHIDPGIVDIFMELDQR